MKNYFEAREQIYQQREIYWTMLGNINDGEDVKSRQVQQRGTEDGTTWVSLALADAVALVVSERINRSNTSRIIYCIVYRSIASAYTRQRAARGVGGGQVDYVTFNYVAVAAGLIKPNISSEKRNPFCR